MHCSVSTMKTVSIQIIYSNLSINSLKKLIKIEQQNTQKGHNTPLLTERLLIEKFLSGNPTGNHSISNPSFFCQFLHDFSSLARFNIAHWINQYNLINSIKSLIQMKWKMVDIFLLYAFIAQVNRYNGFIHFHISEFSIKLNRFGEEKLSETQVEPITKCDSIKFLNFF